MKMRFKLFFIALLALGAVSCGGNADACKTHTGQDPMSFQATFVESTGTNEVMVQSTGKGCTIEEATYDAKKAALWFLIESGDKPILKTSEEKSKGTGVKYEAFNNPDMFIRWKSDIKGKKREGAYYLITYVFKVDTAQLTEKFVAMGATQSEADLGESIGLPTIAVLPMKESGSDFNTTSVTVFQEYLQDKQFEVYVAAQADKVNNLVAKVSTLEGGEPDPMHDLALSLGSDVYLTVNVSGGQRAMGGVKTMKASIQAQAFETATGKLIGSSTGYSAERSTPDFNPLVQEGTNDAAAKVLSQIKAEWMKMAKKGKPFKISVLSSTKDGAKVDEAIYGGLKSLTKVPIKRQAGGKSSFTYIAYVKDVPNAYELLQKLQGVYKGPGKLEKVSDTGSFLVIKAAGSGEIEINIQ